MSIAADSSWALSLADFIRHSDASLLEEGDKLVKSLEEEVLPCESFAEYCDVVGKSPNFLSTFIFVKGLQTAARPRAALPKIVSVVYFSEFVSEVLVVYKC